jgi:hypothetical protein
MNKLDPSKFSFPEAMSNSNGKTSGSKFGSFIALITGCVAFIADTVALFIVDGDMGQSLVILGSAAAGVIAGAIAGFSYSKKMGTKGTVSTTNIETREE